MYSVCFVCLGNICRSPMCESIFTYILKTNHIKNVDVLSRGTSDEEYGNPVHRGTRQVLRAHGIPVIEHFATDLTRADHAKYDLFVCMDRGNLRACRRIFGSDEKSVLLLDYCNIHRDVADPWYTGDFDTTFDDCIKGCNALLRHLIDSGIAE